MATDMAAHRARQSTSHAAHASGPQHKHCRTYGRTDEWVCTACGQCRRFSEYTLAHWPEPLTFSCDCGVQSRLQRGIVRRVENA